MKILFFEKNPPALSATAPLPETVRPRIRGSDRARFRRPRTQYCHGCTKPCRNRTRSCTDSVPGSADFLPDFGGLAADRTAPATTHPRPGIAGDFYGQTAISGKPDRQTLAQYPIFALPSRQISIIFPIAKLIPPNKEKPPNRPFSACRILPIRRLGASLPRHHSRCTTPSASRRSPLFGSNSRCDETARIPCRPRDSWRPTADRRPGCR